MTENLLTYIQANYLDVIGAIIGLTYLYLEFTAKKSMWIVSIIMALFYIVIFFRSDLYAMSMIYAYFFGASIHGWFTWHQHQKIIILRMPKKAIAKISGLIIITIVSIFTLLKLFTQADQAIAMGDTIATALSVVALWMASKRWAEQWCLLIPANLLTAILMLVQQEYASGLMFLIYFIVSIFGYFYWRKLADNDASL